MSSAREEVFRVCRLSLPVSENKKAFFSVLLAVLLLTGCATIGQQLIDKPKVEYLGMTLKDLSLFEATPVFRFRFTNTNPMGMDVSGVSYNLKINRRKFVKGVSGQNVRIKAISSGELELPVSFNFTDLFHTQGSEDSGVLYEMSGLIRIGPYSLPYETAGRFVIPKIPRIFLQEIRITDLSENSASLLLTLDLDNPNDFPLDVDTLAYVLRLNGAETGAGAVSLSKAVDGKTRVRLSVPVHSVFSGPDDPVYQILRSGYASFEISGAMKLRTFQTGLRGISFQEAGEKKFLSE
ncbi:MAG: LEA type 2 family protein [Desulfococcaceae bacterium]